MPLLSWLRCGRGRPFGLRRASRRSSSGRLQFAFSRRRGTVPRSVRVRTRPPFRRPQACRAGSRVRPSHWHHLLEDPAPGSRLPSPTHDEVNLEDEVVRKFVLELNESQQGGRLPKTHLYVQVAPRTVLALGEGSEHGELFHLVAQFKVRLGSAQLVEHLVKRRPILHTHHYAGDRWCRFDACFAVSNAVSS